MTTNAATAAHAGRQQRAGWVLAIVIATTALTGISVSIMVVTFPAIRDEFQSASPAQLSWINNLFTIVSAAVLIPCGVLADRIGRKRMLLIGNALFTVGTLIGAFAPSPAWIMAGRTVQAIGAAAFGPASTALLISAFPPERLPFAVGIWAVTSGVSAAAGPSLGGLLVNHGGWPWAFWLTMPIGLFVMVCAPFVLRESSRDATRRLPDLFSVLLVIAATSTITLGVVQRKTAQNWQWHGRNTLLCFALGAALFALLIDRCRRCENPLLDLALFRANNVRVGALGLFVSGLAFYALYWAFVQHTVNRWDWSIAEAGIATSPMSLVSGLSAVASSRVAGRFGQRLFICVGSIGVVASSVFLWLAMGDSPSLAVVLIGGSTLGLFSGLVFPAYLSTTLLGIPAAQHSIGSSINFMVQRTSATFGTALAITFIAGASGNSGLRNALLVCLIGSAIGFVLGFRVETPRADPLR